MAQGLLSTDQIKRDLEKEFKSYAAKGFKLIHTNPTRQAIIDQVNSTKNKMDGISTAAYTTVAKLDQAARDAKLEIHDGVKLNAANVFVGDIATITKNNLTPEEYKTTLALTVQKYFANEIAAGRIDRNALMQQIQGGVNEMSPEERQEVDSHIQEIDQTASGVGAETEEGMETTTTSMLESEE